MQMAIEICGDVQLSFAKRLCYLAQNFLRNVRYSGLRIKPKSFCRERLPRTPSTASPSRALTEAFMFNQLPKMLPLGDVRVLEIGCGSGSLTSILAEIGYSGTYVGVDVINRFNHSQNSQFYRTFVLTDANKFEAKDKFDLVVSVSALEHIPDDHQLIPKLAGFLKPGGLQLHFVPSGWGLPVYLWHGYRQYTSTSLASRFNHDQTTLYALGGFVSFTLHFAVITMAEMLIGLKLRKYIPHFYGRLLDICLKLDRLFPFGATMYAVSQSYVASPPNVQRYLDRKLEVG
jgi:SAM-dependent methyltransferase